MIYDGMTVGINTVFMTAITFVLAWTFGLENPFSDPNHVVEFINIVGFFILPVICAGIGAWLQFYIPKKWDLRSLLLWDYVFMGIGLIIAYIGAIPGENQSDVIFQQPPNLWLVSIGLSIFIIGFLGNFIYLNPLNADVVDYDEFLTGNRRESVYSGLNCIISKPMASVALAVFPAILSAYGLVAASPEDPTSSALVVKEGMRMAIQGVSVGAFLFPAILAGIGFFSWLFYPLNRQKLNEIRSFLEKKHTQQRGSFQEKQLVKK
jgi:hypothetical protein